MNNTHSIGGRPGERGFVLHMAFVLLLLVSAASGLILYSAYNHGRAVRRAHLSDQCLLDAQSAIERIKHEIVQAYLVSPEGVAGSLSWFTIWDTDSIGSDPAYVIPSLDPVNGSEVTVAIAGVTLAETGDYALVEMIGAAARSQPFRVRRIISETLRVSGRSGAVVPFEYAYLINSSARLRNNMVINGDIRINGICRLNNTATVNGSRYASGQITANSPSMPVATYWTSSQVGPRARPTDPPSTGGVEWPMGYLPSKVKNTDLPAFKLPSVNIQSLSSVAAGQVTRGGTVLAAGFYNGSGPDGIAGTADDGCIVLDGSNAPLSIQGVVVAAGDVIIRGRISGQGAIYAGRNVHITGNLAYVNPPSWPKPDANPVQTAAANSSRDLLFLGAKGNVVVGNYTSSTWSNRVWSIMADPANIAPYEVDESDAALGYDSDNDPSNGYLFDGRYFVSESNNGRRLSGAGTNTIPRKYYESSLANSTFSTLCDASNVPTIDAALLAGHGLIGNMGSSAANGNTTLNGAMACHDELTAFYGTFFINWDIRLGSASRDYVKAGFGPGAGGTGESATTTTIGWRETH